MKAEQVTEPVTFHGEGPFWDERRGRLLVVDMLAGAIVELDGTTPIRHEIGEVAAVVRARTGGGYVAAGEHEFLRLDADFRAQGEPVHAFADLEVRMNEGGCDPQGRFYCGTMAYSAEAGRGTVFRFDPDGTVHTVLEGVTISNGLQWSADGTRTFYVDTPTRRIDVFDFDGNSGAFSNRRPFVEIPESAGSPDGIAIDVEDGIWVAVYGGSAVRHYDSEGDLREVVELPVTNVTACAFGGADRRTLFITTSREGVADGEQPAAGAVFSIRVDVEGATPHLFAG